MVPKPPSTRIQRAPWSLVHTRRLYPGSALAYHPCLAMNILIHNARLIAVMDDALREAVLEHRPIGRLREMIAAVRQRI